MVSTGERYGWIAVIATLCIFAIPWFLWGDSRLVAGVPVWLWYHVGWMLLTAGAFWLFARRIWGIGITGGDADSPGGGRA